MATTPIQTDLSSEKPVKTQRRYYTVGYLPVGAMPAHLLYT